MNDRDAARCTVVEALPADFDLTTPCENLGQGFCTPGASPCRVAAGGLSPVTPQEFVDRTTVEPSLGELALRGNVVAMRDADGQWRKVCELQQLSFEHVPGDQVAECRSNATGLRIRGWCVDVDIDACGENGLAVNIRGYAYPIPYGTILSGCESP